MTTQSVDPRTGLSFGPIFPDTSREQSASFITQAVDAYLVWMRTTTQDRARVLEALADALDSHVEELVTLADSETALGIPRLTGEVGRMTFQFRAFALALKNGISANVVDAAVDAPLPQGHPQFLKTYRGIGVVAIYGASNFPFAFSVFGGDTASALAAGCAVVVKAHPAHPQTSQRVFEIAQDALAKAGAPLGLVGLGHGFEFGATLIKDPRISAAAFTGSRTGGRALFDLAVSRPNPIPFYGELGSVNPVVVTSSALADSEKFVGAYLDSLFMGGGQFCTNPSVLFVPADSDFTSQLADQIARRSATPFLSEATKKLHDANREVLLIALKGEVLAGHAAPEAGFFSTPEVVIVSAKDVSGKDALSIECFGPTGVVITYSDASEVIEILSDLEGALVGSLFANVTDSDVPVLLDALSSKVGRVAWNAWPTGVSVTAGQNHGGPYPASTSPLHTSVGLDAIQRFLRPVTYQGLPSELAGLI
ncbi:MAG: aldehyde dehydrogenase family protein [Actinobacteria bacterium]|nr:aldehyde dehydrogenase family protein [Actinomycetota bacterium]